MRESLKTWGVTILVMAFRRFLVAVAALPIGLAGCSTSVDAAIRDLEVCAQSAEILTEINEVVQLVGSNPLGLPTYKERVEELLGDFNSLEPGSEELRDAHIELGQKIQSILDIADNPSLGSVATLPQSLAEAELAAIDFVQICSP